jgi:hypothetical protein
MHHQNYVHLSATCRCKRVEFEAFGTPIVSAKCYCESCREAGVQFERLPAAPPILDTDGGTSIILFRKDRVRCANGLGYLEERRLPPTSATRRVIATCCNSAMFLDFTSGHWLSMYRNRFTSDTAFRDARSLRQVHAQAADILGQDGIPQAQGHLGKSRTMTKAAD